MTRQVPILAGHCLITSCYFKPCCHGNKAKDSIIYSSRRITKIFFHTFLTELPCDLDHEGSPLHKLLSEPDNDKAVNMQAVSNILASAPASRSDARFLSRGSSYPYQYEQSNSKSTVQFNSCIISKGFLKDRPKDSIVGSMIGKALLANADALCAAATPMMNTISDV